MRSLTITKLWFTLDAVRWRLVFLITSSGFDGVQPTALQKWQYYCVISSSPPPDEPSLYSFFPTVSAVSVSFQRTNLASFSTNGILCQLNDIFTLISLFIKSCYSSNATLISKLYWLIRFMCYPLLKLWLMKISKFTHEYWFLIIF